MQTSANNNKKYTHIYYTKKRFNFARLAKNNNAHDERANERKG